LEFVIDWRLFFKYSPKPFKITINGSTSSALTSSSSSVASSTPISSKTDFDSSVLLNDRYQWSDLHFTFSV